MSERIWYLKNCDLFEQLPSDELKEVEKRCRVRQFPRKSPIYLPADEASGVLLVGAGRVKIASFTAEGKQSILTFIEPGEIFGELSIIEEGARRDEYAEAVEITKVVLIPAGELHRLVEKYPRISLGVTKLIGLRRKRIERRLKYLLFHSNRERLVHLLLELAEKYGNATQRGVELSIKLSHQDLANIIGSTRETVTVILGELQAQKYIKMGRRRITLTDPSRLAHTIDAATPHLPQAMPKWDADTASQHSRPARNTI